MMTMMNAMRFRLTLSLVLATLLLASQALSQPYDTATEAETGMVASVHRLASEAALEVLQQGGNAVDAAAVVQFVLNVVEPAGSGIGGGNFIMIYLAEEGQVIEQHDATTLVLRDSQPFMAVGSPGGSRIFGIVLNVVTNVIDHGMDPQEAITAARIVNRGGAMEIEADLYDANPELIEALEALGHEVARQEPFGGAHAVMVDPETGRLLGGADPRREGHVADY